MRWNNQRCSLHQHNHITIDRTVPRTTRFYHLCRSRSSLPATDLHYVLAFETRQSLAVERSSRRQARKKTTGTKMENSSWKGQNNKVSSCLLNSYEAIMKSRHRLYNELFRAADSNPCRKWSVIRDVLHSTQAPAILTPVSFYVIH